MILNYSIDILYPRIQDSRTKEYFDEVLSCFYSGNYRSAVVMLYSVAICDLVFKLHRLKDLYNDKAATEILERLEAMQEANPKSPDWENTLRDELVRNRRILTPFSNTHLDNLQKERHLCAHPVLKNSIELFRPSKIAVEAHIVNVLADVLTLPPFLEKELLVEILTDMDSQRRHLTKRNVIEDYLKSRYLDRIKSPEIECRLFINLWKFVFSLSNEECDRNRGRNHLFLQLLLSRNHDLIINQIKTESEKLSRQVDIANMKCLEGFIRLMNEFPELYPLLEESFRISLEAKTGANPQMEHISFFLKEDLATYYPALQSSITDNDDLDYIMSYTEKKLNKEAAMSLPIAVFSRSGSFDEARDYFDELIEPRLNEFSTLNLQEVLEAISNNSQIRNCYHVQDFFSRIKNTILERRPGFDFTPYPFIQ